MSKYYSDKETEKMLAELERKIAKEYKRAYREMQATASEYFDKLKDRYEQEYEAYQKGAYTDEQFTAWYRTQVERGEGYEKMADQLANRMVNADQVASAYINDTTPSIYSLNHNYEAYKISQAYENIDFHLTDEQTVKELMMGENHTEFKTTKINPTRDYEWNSEQIHSALTANILQGKGISKLADSYMSVMKRNRASAVRNARTSVTSAQNAGRQKSYEEATNMGIDIQKEWMATLDSRTRDSHQRLDGERVPYDGKFSNGLKYPADPDGAPAEVYNCRCTMRAFLPKFNNNITKRAYKTIGNDGEERREFDDNGEPKTFNGTYRGKNSTKSFSEFIKAKQSMKNVQYKQKLLNKVISNPVISYYHDKSIVYNMEQNEVMPIEPVKIADSFSMKIASNMVCGQDNTIGSCISQAFAYIGARAGYDMKDYRGGASLGIMLKGETALKVTQFDGVTSKLISGHNEVENVHELLSDIEVGKEYLLCTGEHSAIIAKTGDSIKALELQDNAPYLTKIDDVLLKKRFACKTKSKDEITNILFDVDSLYNNSEFIQLLKYINSKGI